VCVGILSQRLRGIWCSILVPRKSSTKSGSRWKWQNFLFSYNVVGKWGGLRTEFFFYDRVWTSWFGCLTDAANPVTSTKKGSTRRASCKLRNWKIAGIGLANVRSIPALTTIRTSGQAEQGIATGYFVPGFSGSHAVRKHICGVGVCHIHATHS
jgi:hypothetical protein